MSRNNVFKLSGNMALGSEAYPNDISDIKQSLKLLKAKQNQRKGDQYPDPNYPYSGGSSNGAYGGTNGQSNGTYSANLPQRNSRGNEKGYDAYEQAVRNNVPRRETYEDPYGKQYENYKQPSVNQRGSQRRNEDFQYKVERPNDRKNTKADYQQDYQQKPTYSRQPQYQQQRRAEPEKKDQRRREPERRRQPQRRQPQRRQPQRRKEGGRGRQQEYVNPIEQKSIKEVNKQNRVDIVEYDPSELVECGQGCGRKFNPNSIDKHEAICKKVFQKKRKEFNTQEQRLVVKDQRKMMKQGEAIQRKMEEKKAKQKIPKWKAESLAFRAGLKATSGNGGGLSKEEQKMLDASKKADTMQCQFCGRNFNHTAGARHVAFCEQQSKKNSFKR